MASKKEIIDNILMRELIAIRTDTLWRMLGMLQRGNLPGANEEGATGKLDNKGAIFIPGGLIYQDVDDRQIAYEAIDDLDEDLFRKMIRESMRFDNATLLFPNGMANSVNLDSGFFSRAVRRIYTYKTAAFKRKRRLGPRITTDFDSNDIVRSHCPTYMDPPYGSRTRISTCVSIGLADPHMYFAYCKTNFCHTRTELSDYALRLDTAQEGAWLPDGKMLYPPHVIVCHDTRYKENNLTGLIRILGIGRFGEFSTFTFERINKQLHSELRRKDVEITDEHVFAEYAGIQVLGILRSYGQTNPGRRSLKYRLDVLSPEKDLGLNLQAIAERAQARYRIDVA